MLGFLIAAAAGFVTPQLDGPVAKPIAAMLEGSFKIEPQELRLISFMVAMIAAAVLANIFDSGSTFGIIAGGIIGYFGMRIYTLLRRIIEARTDDN